MTAKPQRAAPILVGSILAVVLCLLIVASLRTGSSSGVDLGSALRALCAKLSLAESLPGHLQVIAELRLWRALVAAGAGAALALSGALLQGLFRNGLASPSVIGVSAGASLGAALAIVVVGGYGPRLMIESGAQFGPWLVVGGSFAGALAVCLLVLRLSSSGGRVSVPTLLLVGIAVNTCVSGVLAAIQVLTLTDFEIARAILTWTFGTLDDRSALHGLMVWAGLAIALLLVPLVAVELDLLAGGEEDAEALGVDTRKIKLLALGAAALSAAVATAVAGQISFVGLIVPHLLRLLVGHSHRSLLWLSALGGAVFLLGADLLQRLLLGDLALQPGVVMSIVGGPFFLFLLWRARLEVRAW